MKYENCKPGVRVKYLNMSLQPTWVGRVATICDPPYTKTGRSINIKFDEAVIGGPRTSTEWNVCSRSLERIYEITLEELINNYEI